jgi:hypothetical protein
LFLTPFENNVTTVDFPPTPDDLFLSQSLAGFAPVPSYSGNDLYCPLVLTPSGLTFDKSQIGNIEASIYPQSFATSQGFNKLLCDGNFYYCNHPTTSNNFSALGIPYSRLQNFLIQNSPVANVPMYGTGSNFATCYSTTNTNLIRLSVNKNGSVSSAAAGNITGWTFTQSAAGTSANGYTAYNNVANTIIASCPSSPGSPTADAGDIRIFSECIKPDNGTSRISI